MGKQTKLHSDHFGGRWTKEKLAIVEEYLDFYTTVLGKTNVTRIYVDAFAGSGKVVTRSGEEVVGSALTALKYNFNEYYFIELDPEKIQRLKVEIELNYPGKKVFFYNDNCNTVLLELLEKKITCYTRCLMFLDPYALELSWDVIENISKNKCIDLWYLFPLNSYSRLFPKRGLPDSKIVKKISYVLGSEDWQKCYVNTRTHQLSLFDVEEAKPDFERVDYECFVDYIKNRLEKKFKVAHFRILKQGKNAPLFLLCFLMTNDSQSAKNLGSKGFNAVITAIDKRILAGEFSENIEVVSEEEEGLFKDGDN